MKKTFLYCFAGLLPACIISNVYSQNIGGGIKYEAQPGLENGVSIPNDTNGDIAAYLPETNTNKIKNKSLKKFTRKYRSVVEARWFKSSTGLLVAFFDLDDIQTYLYYNKNGSCEYIMRYYEEEDLPAEVYHLVKSTYDDFSINQVTEVRKNDKIAYVVKMENNTYWKTVKVVGGEMEVTEEYQKR